MPFIREDSEYSNCDQSLVVQTSSNSVFKKPTNVIELLRNSDPYYVETAKTSVIAIIKYT